MSAYGYKQTLSIRVQNVRFATESRCSGHGHRMSGNDSERTRSQAFRLGLFSVGQTGPAFNSL